MKKIITTAIAVIMSATAAITANTTANDTIANAQYLQFVTIADSAIAISDWKTAENAITLAIESQPSNPANLLLLSNLGMIQFYQGNDSAALATLNTAAAIAPRTIPIIANRMTVLDAMGFKDAANDDAHTILNIDSTNIKARIYIFDNHIRHTQFQEAKQQLDTLLTLDKENPLTTLAQATFYTATSQYSEAISPLTKIIESKPTAEYFAARAHCRLMTQNLNDASADIAEGLRLNPALPELYLYRAILNKMRYRTDDAKADAQRAIQLGIDPACAQSLLK